MRVLPTEYLLKGVYLGLVLFAALHLGTIKPEADAQLLNALLRVNLTALAGLGLALLIAAVLRFKDALRAHGRLLAFLLFLLLESPTLTYLGILGGTFAGVYLLRSTPGLIPQESLDALQHLFVPIIGVGAAAGLAFGLLRQVQHRLARLCLILALAGGLVACGLSWLGLAEVKGLSNLTTFPLENAAAFAWQLLLGIPFFYLLTFSGHEEESEVEIGIISGLLGLGLYILIGDNRQFNSLAFL